MKKYIILVLCLSLVLVGCKKKDTAETQAENIGIEENSQSEITDITETFVEPLAEEEIKEIDKQIESEYEKISEDLKQNETASESVETVEEVLVSNIDPEGEETTTFMENDQDGIYSRVEYFAKGDQVLTQRSINSYSFSEMQEYLQMSRDEMIAVFEDVKKEYDSLSFVNYEVDIQEDQITETMEVDYTKATNEELQTTENIGLFGNVENGISLELTIESMKSAGYKIVE